MSGVGRAERKDINWRGESLGLSETCCASGQVGGTCRLMKTGRGILTFAD